VPDKRGYFARGWDDGRGVDSGRVFGSLQADELRAHTHTVPAQSNANSGTFVEDADGSGSPQAVNTGSTGGAETRPVNIALAYFIKD
jgi:phage-related tail fiber protein